MKPRTLWRTTALGTTVTLHRWSAGYWSVNLRNDRTAATLGDFMAGLLWRDDDGGVFFDPGRDPYTGNPAAVYPMSTDVLRAIADMADLVRADVPHYHDVPNTVKAPPA